MQRETILDQSVLSEQQIKSFNRDGFVVIRGLYTRKEVDEISRWVDDIAAQAEVPGKQMMYFETSQTDNHRILCRIENFVPYHEGFSKLITTRRMHQAVSELFGEPAVLFKDKINFKLPGGDGFKEHQDVQAGWDEYASIHLTAMVAIDETTAENGSLEMLPGMHKQGLLGEKWKPLPEQHMGSAKYEAVHCLPGDAVFFDSYAPHRSAPNHTDQARRVLYITYNKLSEGDSRAAYYAAKRLSYPPDIERDPSREYRFRV